MFDETIVVQSAISAFNNAALAAPAFLWWAILAMPLFVLVYFCGNVFLERIGWTGRALPVRISLATVVLTLAWIILFGGNYGVLRDNTSILPFMTAVIAFVASLFIGSHSRNVKLPAWRGAPRKRKLAIAGTVALVLVAVGLSDVHAWWGPLLQIGAVMSGLLIGRAAKCEMRPVAGTLLIIMATTTAMLMQPEYFRFGQLGALSAFHLLFLVLVGAAAAAVAALGNVNARGRIHHSAYVKLKWMLRFIAVLCVALFVLTESVPVYLGMLGVFFVMFAMSIWHAEKLPDALAARMFAVTLGLFGIITTMPVITALGILYWINLPCENFWHQSKFLL